MVYFRCPVCGEILRENENGFSCVSGHGFDKASSGYVNLLMSNASGKRHGDDKLMVRSRRDFLEKGFYSGLKKELVKAINKEEFEKAAGLRDEIKKLEGEINE